MVAPAKAPTPPGTAMIPTVRQSTLPSFQCETPETRVVPISEKCTAADAAGGAMPVASSSDDDVTPYPMPSEPSMIWANRPTKARTISVFMHGLRCCEVTRLVQ